jgi:hypothetical protein
MSFAKPPAALVPVALLATLAVAAGTAARADEATLGPARDNTLYEHADGALSNGAGVHLFAGAINTGSLRRGVLAFDVAAAVPAGSTITGATLTLHMSRSISGNQAVAIHRLLADWGEAGSDAGGQEGGGAPAQSGDATWVHTFFDDATWTTAGGDFAASPSASAMVGGIGSYTWGSTTEMVADVQGWLDDPSSAFGWIVIGGEAALGTAKRFDTRENADAGARPLLTVRFDPPAAAAGAVPDGDEVPGVPLAVAKEPGGDITLSWGTSCRAGDDDYEIYEGDLAAFYSHDRRFCTTGGATSITFTPAAGSTYYLVVPTNGTHEGSYGTDSETAERPAGLSVCRPRSIGACT